MDADEIGMSAFFFLQLLDHPDVPVAYGDDAPGRDKVLDEPGRVADWPGLELSVRGGGPTDYLANNLGVRLCSSLLRGVLEQQRGPEDDLQWLPAIVIDETGTRRPYFVLHLTSHPDVLDPQRTIWAKGSFVVKPVLSRQKVDGHRVFSFPGASIRLVIAEPVKTAIQRAACTGVDFATVPSV